MPAAVDVVRRTAVVPEHDPAGFGDRRDSPSETARVGAGEEVDRLSLEQLAHLPTRHGRVAAVVANDQLDRAAYSACILRPQLQPVAGVNAHRGERSREQDGQPDPQRRGGQREPARCASAHGL